MIKTVFAFLGIAIFLLACGRGHPVDFKAGEFACDLCRMQIVDMRFKGEALTQKGKVFHFDSIECLLRWRHTHLEEIKHTWITDFYHPSEWVALENAYLLQSPKLPSPMGEFLSAYAAKESFEKALHEFGGKKIEVEEIR